MAATRLMAAIALLLAGVVHSGPVGAAAQYVCRPDALSPAALRELIELSGGAGAWRLAAGELYLPLGQAPDGWAQRLADWASRHGVKLPARPNTATISPAEAVFAADGQRPIALRAFTPRIGFPHALAPLAGLLPSGMEFRPYPSWPFSRPAAAPAPVLADPNHSRAPPAAL